MRTVPERRRDIQGLRAVAVLLVVTYHTRVALGAGYVGVDVFFVISGFVITQLLDSERNVDGRVDFRRFYARRVRRLLPASAVMILSVLVLSFLLQSPLGAQQTTAKTAAAAAVFAANAELALQPAGYFDPAAESNPLLHMWSLGVEEQFYLFFPALLGLLWAASGKRRGLVLPLGLGAAALGSLLARQLLGAGHSRLVYYSPFTRAWEFAAGAVLAVLLPRLATLPGKVAAVTGVLGLLLIGAGAVGNIAAHLPGGPLMAPVVGAVLVLLAGSRTAWGVRSPLTAGPLVWLGDRSYSWYLWHWPFIVFAGLLFPGRNRVLVVAAALALLPAAASFRFVENPIRRSSAISGRRLVAVGSACAGVPLLATALLGVGAHGYWGSTYLHNMARSQLLHADATSGCDDRLTPAAPGPGCNVNTSARGAPVYLVGDSQAGQFTEAVSSAAKATHRPLFVRTRSRCPLVDARMTFGIYDPQCTAYVAKTTRWLRSAPSGLVLIASITDLVDSPSLFIADPATGAAVHDVTRKQQLWTEGLTRTVDAIRSAGHRVLLVGVLPRVGRWDPQACSVLRAARDSCGTSVALADVQAAGRRGHEVEESAARAAGATVLDLTPFVCPNGQCRTNQGNRWVYRDASHISVDESFALAGAFIPQMRQFP